MIKNKLIVVRKQKGLSQSELASHLGIEQSQYCRRENGDIRINKREWNKIAKFLNVDLSEIYESHEVNVAIPNNDSNSVIMIMQKYIQKLEEENTILKEENFRLKNID